ncbi:PREDICTED: redox-regulatory protein FAM213A-like [Priapulus caudatus]|uniref:Peroxiredoxin-like 2A n=1 Tax=Priapulus caudatus TaxID=37621 RepID=A0ABM1EM47_PRICU|nr:PREDICTED: redox-regulatory protein FAM213A-like [Priapulus caudatus]
MEEFGREARELSSLRPLLEEQGFGLYAVVHEVLGVPEFKPFFGDGEVFLDKERKFYGPKERWEGLTSILSFKVINNMRRASKKGVSGNLKGEGRLLGGVFAISARGRGIVFEHYEATFGDHADLEKLMAAVTSSKSGEGTSAEGNRAVETPVAKDAGEEKPSGEKGSGENPSGEKGGEEKVEKADAAKL